MSATRLSRCLMNQVYVNCLKARSCHYVKLLRNPVNFSTSQISRPLSTTHCYCKETEDSGDGVKAGTEVENKEERETTATDSQKVTENSSNVKTSDSDSSQALTTKEGSDESVKETSEATSSSDSSSSDSESDSDTDSDVETKAEVDPALEVAAERVAEVLPGDKAKTKAELLSRIVSKMKRRATLPMQTRKLPKTRQSGPFEREQSQGVKMDVKNKLITKEVVKPETKGMTISIQDRIHPGLDMAEVYVSMNKVKTRSGDLSKLLDKMKNPTHMQGSLPVGLSRVVAKMKKIYPGHMQNRLPALDKVKEERVSEDKIKTESELLSETMTKTKRQSARKLKEERIRGIVEKMTAIPIARKLHELEETRRSRADRHLDNRFDARTGSDDSELMEQKVQSAFGGMPFGIFTRGEMPAEEQKPGKKYLYDILAEEKEQKKYEYPPKNAWEEQIQWTRQGKLWTFPIDNEAGWDDEKKVGFQEHVFLERQLRDFPQKGPIRHFMELVTVPLSKNPYLTVQQKRDTIDWYRDYFKSKESVLTGALGDTAKFKELPLDSNTKSV